MSGTFVKLYGAILDSSVWLESAETRLVWIAMLAMADANGVVHASIGGLAHRARVDRDACVKALETLSSPDPDSRDGTSGERIARVDGGWVVLNHRRYRDMRTKVQVDTAERVRRYRERQAGGESPPEADSVTVTGGNVQPVTRGYVRTEAEADPYTDPKSEAEAIRRARPRVADPVPAEPGKLPPLPPGDLCSECYRHGSCAIHGPESGSVDPKAERIRAVLAATRARDLGLATPEYAAELLGSLGPLAYNVDGETLEVGLREAIADIPAAATEAFWRKMLRTYVKQLAGKPPGERAHEKLPKPRRARRSAKAEPEPVGALMSPDQIAKLAKGAAGAAKGGT